MPVKFSQWNIERSQPEGVIGVHSIYTNGIFWLRPLDMSSWLNSQNQQKSLLLVCGKLVQTKTKNAIKTREIDRNICASAKQWFLLYKNTLPAVIPLSSHTVKMAETLQTLFLPCWMVVQTAHIWKGKHILEAFCFLSSSPTLNLVYDPCCGRLFIFDRSDLNCLFAQVCDRAEPWD